MRTRNWKEFLYEVVTKFREKFRNELTLDEKNLFQSPPFRKRISRSISLIEPSQIVVFDFIEPFPIVFLITHYSDHPDLDFHIYKQIKDPKELENKITQEKPFWLRNIKSFGFFRDVKKKTDWVSNVGYGKHGAILLLKQKEARENPEYIANILLSFLKHDLDVYHNEKQRDQIGKTTFDLKQDALEIPEPKIRAKVLEATDKIEKALLQMKRLDEYEKKLGLVEEEIGGVRRLIGVTKEYQDFRVLTSTVDEMKKNYVSKAVFDEAIKRVESIETNVDTRLKDFDKRLDDHKTIFNELKERIKWFSLLVIILAIITALASNLDKIIKALTGGVV